MLSFGGQMQSSLQINILQIETAFSIHNKKFGNFDVIVQGRQVEGRVPVVFGLVHEPGSRHFRQQNSHCTEKDMIILALFHQKKPQMNMKGDDHDEDDEVFDAASVAIAVYRQSFETCYSQNPEQNYIMKTTQKLYIIGRRCRQLFQQLIS